jgi:hypothetical protein
MAGARDRHRRGGLWTLILGPTVWSLHFLFCYILAAVYCAKTGSIGVDLGPVRFWIAAATAAALVLIALSGWSAFQQGGFSDEVRPPHDTNTIEDRRRFFGFATLLLAGLSFVATLYVALPAILIGTCR